MSQRSERHRRANNVKIEDGDLNVMLDFFNGKCCYCGIELRLDSGFDNSIELDHFNSLSEQDVDELDVLDGVTLENIVPSCRKCNRTKRDSNPYEWVEKTFKRSQEILYNIEFYFSTQKESLFL